MTMADRKNE